VNLLTIAEQKILIFLLFVERATVREIVKSVGGSATTVVNALKKLRRSGLVDVEEMKEFPFRKHIVLTGYGRRVANHLLDIMLTIELASRCVHGKHSCASS